MGPSGKFLPHPRMYHHLSFNLFGAASTLSSLLGVQLCGPKIRSP